MISRTWHGIVPIEMRDAFEEYEIKTGIKDTKAILGNKGAYLKIVEQGEYAHFFLCTKWNSMESIIAYAGNNPSIAVTYPEDDKYGLISCGSAADNKTDTLAQNEEKDVVLVDDEYVKITYLGLDENNETIPTLKLSIENKTDQTFAVQTENVSADDNMVTTFFSEHPTPGEKKMQI